MEPTQVNGSQVERVEIAEKHMVGVAVTSPFQHVKGIDEARRFFMEHKDSIQCSVWNDEYMCLHFSNDILFTYIYCLEVSDCRDVPDGMIGFSVPSSNYARVRSHDDDPYALIDNYLEENGLESNAGLFSFEVFKFGEKESKYLADIFVPIVDRSE